MTARRVFWLALGLVVAVAAAYSSSFAGKFLLDDYGRIVENPLIRSIPLALTHLSVRYVAETSFAVDYAVGGLNAAYYHFTNLLVHLACTIVLFLIVRLLSMRCGRDLLSADMTAFVSALLWGVHPLATSAVTYICQRYESLMSLFYMLGMFLLVLGASAKGMRGKLLLFGSIISCLFGLFIKQIMVTAPFAFLLLDTAFLAGGFREAIRRRWAYYAVLCVCLGAQIAVMALGPDDHSKLFVSYSGSSGSLMYLLNQGPVLLHYLRLTFWPDPLTLDYAWRPELTPWPLLVPAGVVGGLLAATCYGFFRWPRAFFAALCAFVVLSPTSSLIPIPDLAFEHRMYLPLACLIVSFVMAGDNLVRSPALRRGAVITALMISVPLGVMTYRRNVQYGDPEAMWGEIARRIPHNFRAWSFYTGEKLERHDYAGAEEAAKQMLGRVLMTASMKDARFNIPSSSPDMYEAYGRNLLGRALMGLGRQTEALQQFSAVTRRYPDDIAARHNRSLALLAMGFRAEAAHEIDETLRLNPNHVQAAMIKAGLLADEGSHKEAAALLGRVLAMYPGLVPAKVELAWLLSASYDPSVRDSSRARKLLDEVGLQIGATGTRLMDIQAAILAEEGDFTAAVAMQALALADAKQQYGVSDQRTEDIEKRLDLYRRQTPFRFGARSGAGR